MTVSSFWTPAASIMSPESRSRLGSNGLGVAVLVVLGQDAVEEGWGWAFSVGGGVTTLS